jgi:hypothetical protein
MTGGKAEMSDRVGAEVTAWDGYISGRNLELVPGQRIVQSWRTSEFTDEHADSVIIVTLENAGDGTLLTLVHQNVPDDQKSYEEDGWQSNYFEPMAAYFAERKKSAARPVVKKKAAKSAPKAVRKTVRKARVAPNAKSKRAASQAKTKKNAKKKSGVKSRRKSAPSRRRAAARKRR